jgi:predicted secreted protein
MASAINGTNIILYYYDPITDEGIPFGAATNCTFNVNVDQIEVTSASSAWFREYKNDIATWNVSCDGFVALSNYSYLFLANLQLSRESIQIKFQIDNDNGDGSDTLGYSVFNGTANLTSLSLTGPAESTSTYSVNLQGTGPYTISGTQVAPGGVVVLGSNVVMFDHTASGGETSITWIGSIGLSCVTVTRGGIEVRSIDVSGIPTGENVRFNSSTGVLTFATARPLEADEFVRAIFK